MNSIVGLVLGSYLNEPCRVCGQLFEEKDLSTMVFVGYSVDCKSRCAHLRCWNGFKEMCSDPRAMEAIDGESE